MSDVAIRVEGIGKLYRVGERERYRQLREVLARAFRGGLNGSPRPKDTIWAVRDISFEVHQGEVVGLIGRNGAGKSTLLKVLARITRPTVGRAQIHGRIGSLLEVGTGFHHELTGRENIFLSGAILGMKKAEIRRKFDEIVAFAEIERFLDAPLKHYSSGMQMRLAFAVAAHLEPEILLVDEVLAVGDIQFQKKCLGKMQDVSRTGRTIIFVSHNLSAVDVLCGRALLLEHGSIIKEGKTSEVISAYYARSFGRENVDGDLRSNPRTGNGKAIFTSIGIQPLTPDGAEATVARPGYDLLVGLEIECREDAPELSVDLTIYDRSGYRLVDVSTEKKASFIKLRAGESARVQFRIRELLLKPGSYPVEIWMGRHSVEEVDLVPRATILEVAPDAQNSNSVVAWPGPYTCRFESSIVWVESVAG